MEKDAHAVTRAEFDKCKVRVTELEVVARNAGTEAEEGQEPIFDARVEDIYSITKVHNKGKWKRD